MGEGLPQELRDALAEDGGDEGAALDAQDLEGIVSEMIAARDTVDQFKAALKEAQAAYDDIRKRKLPEKMQALGLVGPDGRGRFTHSSGASVHLRVEIWAYIKKEAQDETYAWLKDNGHGGIVQETVNPQTLRAFVRERLEDGEPLPPGVTTSMETIAVVKRPSGGEA